MKWSASHLLIDVIFQMSSEEHQLLVIESWQNQGLFGSQRRGGRSVNVTLRGQSNYEKLLTSAQIENRKFCQCKMNVNVNFTKKSEYEFSVFDDSFVTFVQLVSLLCRFRGWMMKISRLFRYFVFASMHQFYTKFSLLIVNGTAQPVKILVEIFALLLLCRRYVMGKNSSTMWFFGIFTSMSHSRS